MRLEQLDNSGAPTGVKKNFPTNQAVKMLRMKNSKWRIIEKEKRKEYVKPVEETKFMTKTETERKKFKTN